MKPLDDMTYNDLVDWAKGYLLLAIGRGDFDSSMHAVVQTTLRWREIQREKETKKKPRKPRFDKS